MICETHFLLLCACLSKCSFISSIQSNLHQWVPFKVLGKHFFYGYSETDLSPEPITWSPVSPAVQLAHTKLASLMSEFSLTSDLALVLRHTTGERSHQPNQSRSSSSLSSPNRGAGGGHPFKLWKHSIIWISTYSNMAYWLITEHYKYTKTTFAHCS